MSEENYLLPCPFCSGEAEYKSALNIRPVHDRNGAYIDADVDYWEYVVCKSCGAKIESYDDDEPEEITIEKWNRRMKS